MTSYPISYPVTSAVAYAPGHAFFQPVPPATGTGGDGTMDFSNPDDSGLIVLLEDI